MTHQWYYSTLWQYLYHLLFLVLALCSETFGCASSIEQCVLHNIYKSKKKRGALKIFLRMCFLLTSLAISCISINCIYRVSQEECVRLQEGVPYVKVYWYNPKHLCPKMNGYRDNGQRKVWSSGGSTHCTCQLTVLSMSVLECGVIWRQFSSHQP